MRTHTDTTLAGPTPSWQASMDTACARIAPAWPLDRLIAASPYWGWIDRHITDAATSLSTIAGAPMLMPREWYRAQRDAGRLTDAQIHWAIESLGADTTVDEVLAALAADAPPPMPHPLVSDVCEAARAQHRGTTTHDVIVAQIGRTCEAYFDAGTAAWSADRREGLYGLWRMLAQLDAAARLSLDVYGVEDAVAEFPKSPRELISEALETLDLPSTSLTEYFTALLMSVSGWASVCAHARWEARLAGTDDDAIEQLLAIRLGWELALHRSATGTDAAMQWLRARRTWHDQSTIIASSRRIDWVLQRALEWRHQDGLARALALVPSPMAWQTGPSALGTVRTQVVFCIDVRSEVIRRHLERADPELRTLGFAGFFGLPLAYAAPDGSVRPQLPGLLAPNIAVSPDGKAQAAAASAVEPASDVLAREVPSTFTFVEATGLRASLDLLRSAFGPDDATADAARPRTATKHGVHALHDLDGAPLSVEARVGLAEQVLRGMSLTAGFAPLVAFIGHEAAVTNNPQQAGLQCGACGGQSGEMNARALATLLNEADVREGLAARGIVIPSRTRFVGGVHETVTDTIRVMPSAEVKASHAEEIRLLMASFVRACDATRAERAPRLGVTLNNPVDIGLQYEDRTKDWAEVRPEWGLARNAAFIVAPRDRTRQIQLDGRVFLHEYVWQRDTGFSVLDTILTAPMVVAHWINAQYYASTVDPTRFGSGDKTLHNVVGGSLGVYEGAGGDIRPGLSIQSLHDGRDWVHEPLRLAVYVEAPREALDAAIKKHAVVRHLVEHEWVHLFQIASDDSGVSTWTPQGWARIAPRESEVRRIMEEQRRATTLVG